MSFAYCSIENMFEYLFTKALQRSLFTNCCDVIMGWKNVDTIRMGPPSTKKHVVNVVKVGSNREGIESSMSIST